MAIIAYNSRTDRDKALSANFTVGEFASKDGAATVLVDERLVWYLQRIRDRFARPVTITSGYRSPAHNRAVGGATNSLHTKGQAADIYIDGVEPAEIARYAESLGCLGIGLYTVQRFVHIDTRTSKYYWVNDGREKAVATHGGSGGAPREGRSEAEPSWGFRSDCFAGFPQRSLRGVSASKSGRPRGRRGSNASGAGGDMPAAENRRGKWIHMTTV